MKWMGLQRLLVAKNWNFEEHISASTEISK
jgi:hypothetical protein